MLKLLAADGIDAEIQAHYRLIGSVKDTIGMHTHDFFELFLILQGSVVHVINGQRLLLNENTLVFIRDRDAHCYEQATDGDCRFINLSFCREVIDDLIAFLGSGFPSGRLLEPELPPTLLLSRTEKEYVQYRLDQLNLIPQERKAALKAEARALLTDLFSRYIKTEGETGEHDGQPEWLKKLCREARSKDCFTRGTAELVRLSGKSHAYVCRMFGKHLGMSPTRYINELRMSYAENLLLNTDMEIVEICLEVGLDNVSYFYDLFKRKHGLTPAVYRRLGAVRQYQPIF
ncbi:AraC family transcriptional regulator [Saccharibacillus sp. CPCC 101409]|uniref:AraC family transcriptional regulator n=1 Tax=Saccharibacillus sp. CPCC 101409 TaxID=3058041 RepID=UPI002671762D|nr:AraC family transcriptional regulator [Saccharibacillus sp. CPCC 101409]MDO3411786.1 AraC family transcriptional regulator [Saccharibacillus sp. CPCC 101409]